MFKYIPTFRGEVIITVTDDIDQEVNVSWSSITSELKKSLDKDTFQNWIKPIQFESLLDTSLTLSVPTRFLRDWIIKNYASCDQARLSRSRYHNQ